MIKFKDLLMSIYYSFNYHLEKSISISREKEIIDRKYKPYIDRHYEILEDLKINRNLFSKAINCSDINNAYTKECIKLCYEDYGLAEYIIRWQKELSILMNEKYVPLNYGSSSILIKLLEKQGKYEEAIKMCNNYIELGLINDGTKGGIVARKERLIKKYASIGT